MTTASSAQPKTQSYLARVRTALRGMPEREIEDILRELRRHIDDLSGPDGRDAEAALKSLGDPVNLAKKYRAENQMLQAECSGSPLLILAALRHTMRNRLGQITATALYLFAYINMAMLWAAAIEKLLAPSRGGLWYVPGDWWSISLVIFDNPAPGARELLGWWLVPIALLGGWVVKSIADRIAQWWIARHRRKKEEAREV